MHPAQRIFLHLSKASLRVFNVNNSPRLSQGRLFVRAEPGITLSSSTIPQNVLLVLSVQFAQMRIVNAQLRLFGRKQVIGEYHLCHFPHFFLVRFRAIHVPAQTMARVL